MQATLALPVPVPVPMPSGSLEAYIQTVNRIPLLTLEEEVAYANRLRQHGDLEAAGKLVLSHLRLVVSISRSGVSIGTAFTAWMYDSRLETGGSVGKARVVMGPFPRWGCDFSTQPFGVLKR